MTYTEDIKNGLWKEHITINVQLEVEFMMTYMHQRIVIAKNQTKLQKETIQDYQYI